MILVMKKQIQVESQVFNLNYNTNQKQLEHKASYIQKI
jgi:hypothetical protein